MTSTICWTVLFLKQLRIMMHLWLAYLKVPISGNTISISSAGTSLWCFVVLHNTMSSPRTRVVDVFRDWSIRNCITVQIPLYQWSNMKKILVNVLVHNKSKMKWGPYSIARRLGKGDSLVEFSNWCLKFLLRTCRILLMIRHLLRQWHGAAKQ